MGWSLFDAEENNFWPVRFSTSPNGSGISFQLLGILINCFFCGKFFSIVEIIDNSLSMFIFSAKQLHGLPFIELSGNFDDSCFLLTFAGVIADEFILTDCFVCDAMFGSPLSSTCKGNLTEDISSLSHACGARKSVKIKKFTECSVLTCYFILLSWPIGAVFSLNELGSGTIVFPTILVVVSPLEVCSRSVNCCCFDIVNVPRCWSFPRKAIANW